MKLLSFSIALLVLIALFAAPMFPHDAQAADVFFPIVHTKVVTQTAPFTSKLPDTGMYACHDDDTIVVCPNTGEDFFGQDAQYNEPRRQHNYTDNGDGTITDNVTGLMWQQDDDDVIRSWQDSIDYCAALTHAAHLDWRLPDYYELFSLTDRSRYDPTMTIDPIFGGHASEYWTSSPEAVFVDKAFLVHFDRGEARYDGMTNEEYVRCVRSGPLPTASFVDNGDGTVTDETTGLMWMQSDDGLTRNWKDALAYCETMTASAPLAAGHSDWRLPDVNELQTLVDIDVRFPSIDESVFSCENGDYWSSSSSAGNSDYAWRVFFGYSTVSYSDKGATNYVRCVRSGP